MVCRHATRRFMCAGGAPQCSPHRGRVEYGLRLFVLFGGSGGLSGCSRFERSIHRHLFPVASGTETQVVFSRRTCLPKRLEERLHVKEPSAPCLQLRLNNRVRLPKAAMYLPYGRAFLQLTTAAGGPDTARQKNEGGSRKQQ